MFLVLDYDGNIIEIVDNTKKNNKTYYSNLWKKLYNINFEKKKTINNNKYENNEENELIQDDIKKYIMKLTNNIC